MKQIIIIAMMLSGLSMSVDVLAQTNENVDSIAGKELVTPTKLTLQVKGMSCQAGCANGIDNMLKQQSGVEKSKTTYATESSVIWYNQKLITQEELIEMIKDRGYKVKAKQAPHGENL